MAVGGMATVGGIATVGGRLAVGAAAAAVGGAGCVGAAIGGLLAIGPAVDGTLPVLATPHAASRYASTSSKTRAVDCIENCFKGVDPIFNFRTYAVGYFLPSAERYLIVLVCGFSALRAEKPHT